MVIQSGFGRVVGSGLCGCMILPMATLGDAPAVRIRNVLRLRVDARWRRLSGWYRHSVKGSRDGRSSTRPGSCLRIPLRSRSTGRAVCSNGPLVINVLAFRSARRGNVWHFLMRGTPLRVPWVSGQVAGVEIREALFSRPWWTVCKLLQVLTRSRKTGTMASISQGRHPSYGIKPR